MHKDEAVIDRIKEIKSKWDRNKERIKELQEDSVMDQLKIEMLTKRASALNKKKDHFKKDFIEVKKDN